MRAGGRLYRALLLQAFPRYYRTVAWATTGFPISWPWGARRAWRELRSLEERLSGRVGTVGLRGLAPRGYTDYPAWLRQEPARSFVTSVLEASDALYPEYTARDEVVRLWREHLAGADHARALGHRLTLEIWLQQVFNGRYRQEESR
jgi:asparagine synthase (glutamine-hydrolysing)